jgi:uncharacterized membrane protein
MPGPAERVPSNSSWAVKLAVVICGQSGLDFVATMASPYIAVLILLSQRQADMFSQHREHLNLKLAILSLQKTAKVSELFEEASCDNSLISNPADEEADAMAKPANRQTLLETIIETNG